MAGERQSLKTRVAARATFQDSPKIGYYPVKTSHFGY
jgi:hypothetical protein